MTCAWNFIVFSSVFIFCVTIWSKAIEVELEKIDQVIEVGYGENVTLLCNPSLRNNLTLSSLVSDFEWVADRDLPIFTNGKLSLFLFDFDADNSSFAIDTHPPGTLILRNFFEIKNVTYTCTFSTPLTKVSYTYLLQTKRNSHVGDSSSWLYKDIGWKNGDRVVLPCAPEHDGSPLPTDFSYFWLLRKTRPNNREEVEMISMNRNIILKNNTKGFHVAENRSLIIPSFMPSWRTRYECHTSIGAFISYGTTQNKKDIAVEQGNDVSLKCPVGDANFVWIRNTTEVLFVNGRAFKNRKTDNLKIDYDKELLNITNFSPSLSGTYTCSGTNGEYYQYNVTKRAEMTYTVLNGEDILGQNISLDCPSNSTSDSFRVWTRNFQNDVEVLFINGETAAGNENDKLKTVNNGRKLLINDFSYGLGGVYSCVLDTGINSTYNITVPNEHRERSLSVDYGTRNLVLPCPLIHKNKNSSVQWFFMNSIFPESSLLFLNQEKFGYHLLVPSNFYEINDDGSLVILAVKRYQYGEYTCRRTTGEEYVYKLKREYKWINDTILITSDRLNVTLPCPLNDPRDREYNSITWVLMAPSMKVQDFTFRNGKTYSKLPEYIKLHGNKESLIVPNPTSIDSTNFECRCYLIYSGTIYRYRFTNLLPRYW